MNKRTLEKYTPEGLIHLAKLMKANNYNFYIVGGFVRDIFLGSCDSHENDIDVCGDCTPEVFAQIISNDHRIKLCEANYPLGTLKLIVGKLDIEYTCFRTESYRGDGFHTPSKIVFTTDILKDAQRRDFSINALYLDPLTCEIVDFFEGQNDIKNKMIKTVRESKKVFTEDALRILRMCRFSAKLGFNIADATMKGAIECSSLLNNISKERIGVELDRILCDTENLSFGIDAIFNSTANEVICKTVKKETALKVCSATQDRYVLWGVFLSDNSPKDAKKYILSLSLGKELAKEVYRLITNKKIADRSKDEIIIHFAKSGKEAAKRQIEFLDVMAKDTSSQLNNIYQQMILNNQFISYDMLKINGHEIMDLLSVKGKEIKFYKDKAYEYAILNPQKNNLEDLRNFLINIS